MTESALYSGFISHERFLPKRHRFSYPFFMWYLDLEHIDDLHGFEPFFSSRKWAMSRFRRSDYLGDPEKPLAACVKEKMAQLTGDHVTGTVFGLLNLRTFGLYFSPVNFYYGFAKDGNLSHLLAEVSNIPWNERHYYAYRLNKTKSSLTCPKLFKVSPFNPEKGQRYKWIIETPGKNIVLNLGVHDERGHIFEAALRLEKQPFTKQTVQELLFRKPVMTASIVAGIYWQALKLFLKGVPYISYEKEGA